MTVNRARCKHFKLMKRTYLPYVRTFAVPLAGSFETHAQPALRAIAVNG